MLNIILLALAVVFVRASPNAPGLDSSTTSAKHQSLACGYLKGKFSINTYYSGSPDFEKENTSELRKPNSSGAPIYIILTPKI